MIIINSWVCRKTPSYKKITKAAWQKKLVSDWAQKYFLRIFLCPIRDKHSTEPCNWFIKRSIPGSLSPFLENFCHRFSRPDSPPLGLCGCFHSNSGFRKCMEGDKWILHTIWRTQQTLKVFQISFFFNHTTRIFTWERNLAHNTTNCRISQHTSAPPFTCSHLKKDA